MTKLIHLPEVDPMVYFTRVAAHHIICLIVINITNQGCPLPPGTNSCLL